MRPWSLTAPRCLFLHWSMVGKGRPDTEIVPFRPCSPPGTVQFCSHACIIDALRYLATQWPRQRWVLTGEEKTLGRDDERKPALASNHTEEWESEPDACNTAGQVTWVRRASSNWGGGGKRKVFDPVMLREEALNGLVLYLHFTLFLLDLMPSLSVCLAAGSLQLPSSSFSPQMVAQPKLVTQQQWKMLMLRLPEERSRRMLGVCNASSVYSIVLRLKADNSLPCALTLTSDSIQDQDSL